MREKGVGVGRTVNCLLFIFDKSIPIKSLFFYLFTHSPLLSPLPHKSIPLEQVNQNGNLSRNTWKIGFCHTHNIHAPSLPLSFLTLSSYLKEYQVRSTFMHLCIVYLQHFDLGHLDENMSIPLKHINVEKSKDICPYQTPPENVLSIGFQTQLAISLVFLPLCFILFFGQLILLFLNARARSPRFSS